MTVVCGYNLCKYNKDTFCTREILDLVPMQFGVTCKLWLTKPTAGNETNYSTQNIIIEDFKEEEAIAEEPDRSGEGSEAVCES